MKTKACPACGGDPVALGGLGNLLWFRCRDCGAEFSSKIRSRKAVRKNGHAVTVVALKDGSHHTVRAWYGGRAKRLAEKDVNEMRRRAKKGDSMFAGSKAGYAMLANKKRKARSRRNAPNLKTSRHILAAWKIGEAAHKFLSHMDSSHLSLWRELSMWDIKLVNQKATTARKASASTVNDRYFEFIAVLNKLWPKLQKKVVSKAPLRIVAGSWGMMEEMRTDF